MIPGEVVISVSDPTSLWLRVSDPSPVIAGTVVHRRLDDGTICNVGTGGTLAGIAAANSEKTIFTDGDYVQVMTRGRIWCLAAAGGSIDNGKQVQYTGEGRVAVQGDDTFYNARFADVPQAYGPDLIALVDISEVISAFGGGIGSTETITTLTTGDGDQITVTVDGVDFDLAIG